MGGLLFLIVVLIVFGLAYYIGIMAYSYTMESLHTFNSFLVITHGVG